MKKTLIKMFSFILCLSMLLGVSALTVCAKEQEHAPEYTPVEWRLDPELEYIYGGEKRYERYYVYKLFYVDATTRFCFTNKASLDGKLLRVYGDSADPHIVSVSNSDGYSYIFADKEGEKILDDFLDRIDCTYFLESSEDTYSVLDGQLVSSLTSSYKTGIARLKQVKVQELSDAEILDITTHDRTESMGHQHGAVYIMPNGSYYFVCFEYQDNSHFDADGYFSYRSGTVGVLELHDNFRKQIDTAVEQMTPRERNIIYESDVIAGFVDVYGNPIDDGYGEIGGAFDDGSDGLKVFGVVIFFILTIGCGLILPVALLILGLVLARSEKTNKAKCWYALSISAAVWIVAGLAFFLIAIL